MNKLESRLLSATKQYRSKLLKILNKASEGQNITPEKRACLGQIAEHIKLSNMIIERKYNKAYNLYETFSYESQVKVPVKVIHPLCEITIDG